MDSKMSISGRHLKVGAVSWNPFVMLNNPRPGQHSGILINALNNIAGVLNFTYSIIKPSDSQWGTELPNGSFTGMIGMCQRKEVDVALGPFVLAWDRFQVIEYSSVFHFDDYRILLPRPKSEVDLSGVAKPLAWKVWMSLAIAVCLSLVTGYIMNQVTMYIMKTFQCQRKLSPIDRIKPSWIPKVMSAEVVAPLPKTINGRIYLLTWMIGGFILQAAYSSVLISLLAVPKVPIPVDSLEDLLAYEKQPYGVYPGTYFYGVLQKTDSEMFKKTLRGAINFTAHNTPGHIESVKRERQAIIATSLFLIKVQSDDYTDTAKCNFYLAKESVLAVASALAFQKESDLAPLFDKWLVAHWESGILSKPIKDLLSSVTVCMMAPGKESGSSLKAFGFMDLSGIFLLYGVGVTGGLIVFVLEIVLNKINVP